MDLPDYAVIRPAPDLPPGFLPPDMDGRWYDRSQMPVMSDEQAEARDEKWRAQGGSVGSAVAVPTDRFEVRDDGAVAQVWEVRP